MTEAIACWQTDSPNMLLLANISFIMSFILSFLDMLHDVLLALSSTSERTYRTMLSSLALNNFLEKLACVVIITLVGTLYWFDMFRLYEPESIEIVACKIENWSVGWASWVDGWQGIHTLSCSIDCFLCLLRLNLFFWIQISPCVCLQLFWYFVFLKLCGCERDLGSMRYPLR